MTINLKTVGKNVKFGVFTKAADVTTSTIATHILSLDTAQSGTGISASLSGGAVVLADKSYIGFFKPFASYTAGTPLEIAFYINGLKISSQQEAIKSKTVAASDTSFVTRLQPAFFTYTAQAGDILTIRYTTQETASCIFYGNTIYMGNLLILWEIDK
jgi:hypothetical protein